jgi:PAS domain S-box-containing protein
MGLALTQSARPAWFADEQVFAQLASRSEFLRCLLEHLQDGLVVADTQGKCLLINRALCEMTGFSGPELLGRPPYPYWPAADVDAIRRAQVPPMGEPTAPTEVWLQRKDGARFPAVLRPSWITDDHGKALALLTTIIDLTAARQAEAALEASAQRWRAIAQNPFDFVMIIGRDYKYRFMNHVTAGRSPEDFVGKLSPLDFLDAQDQPRVRHVFDEAFRTGRPSSYEIYVPEFGRWFMNVVGAIQSDGEIQELSLMSRDITEAKRVEGAQRRSERRLALALASVQDGLVEIDPHTGNHAYSARTYELLGFADADPELSTQTDGLLARVHPEDAALVAPKLRTALERGSSFDQELRVRARDGSFRWFHMRGGTVEDEGEHFLAFLTDITQRYEAEEQRRALAAELQQAQRLETIGMLAGGIAHDFNNLLTPIVGGFEFAQLALPGGHPAHAVLTDALSAAQRAKCLTEQILSFARRAQHTNLEPVDLVRVVREELRLQPEAAAVQLVTELSHEHPMVMGDATQLQQIVANLLTNAIHAMRGLKGVLSLRVDRVQLAHAEQSVFGRVPPGEYARLTVKDQGVGMSESVQQRLFERFFTTKPLGEGTGLGLAVVHGVVTRHAGHLRLQSQPGSGTTFEVYLPIWKSTSARNSDAPVPAPMCRSPKGHVLCVDDEPGVMSVMTRALELAGFSVSATTTPTEALEWFRNAAGSFDALVTDFRMPQLSGLELAQRILAVRSDLPVILVTGHAEGLPQSGPPPGIYAVLHKPFRISELIQCVQSALAAGRAEAPALTARW